MLKQFVRNKSFKQLGLYLVGIMFFVFLTEYIVIRHKIEVLEEIEEKKDYARSAQLSGQQIALLVHEYLNDNKAVIPQIITRIDQQDHLMEVIRNGGRIDGTDIFLKPLSRLPRISFEQLQAAWDKYKGSVNQVILQNPDLLANDTTGILATERAKVIAMIPAQWLTLSNWYAHLETDLTDEANEKKIGVERWVFIFIFADLLLLVTMYLGFRKYVLNPLEELKTNTYHQQQVPNQSKNEIGDLTHEINAVLEQLKDATEFVGAIREGKLDFDYRTLDAEYEEGRNKLADSLIAMQEKLKMLNIEEQRRQWANDGLSKFVDILRSNDNLHTLGDKIISALVQYTGSNQGGLYSLNDEDEGQKHLELISLFAFDVKKYEKRKIKLGEGILGQTFLEKETTLLNEVPDEYIRITSGLGEANPKSLLLVPLKVDREVYGIVELASFRPYEEHEIQFVEKLAETIASTLASVKAVHKNKQLLEQFQQQTEEMKAQEEEMRQNMEEIQATHEEMGRKEREYIQRIQQLETSLEEANSGAKAIDALKSEFANKEMLLQQQVDVLQKRLSEKTIQSDDWVLAQEVEAQLRIQLEALRLTQESTTGKS